MSLSTEGDTSGDLAQRRHPPLLLRSPVSLPPDARPPHGRNWWWQGDGPVPLPLQWLQRTSLRGRHTTVAAVLPLARSARWRLWWGPLAARRHPCMVHGGRQGLLHSLGPFLFSSSSTLICKVVRCCRDGGAKVVSTPSWHMGVLRAVPAILLVQVSWRWRGPRGCCN